MSVLCKHLRAFLACGWSDYVHDHILICYIKNEFCLDIKKLIWNVVSHQLLTGQNSKSDGGIRRAAVFQIQFRNQQTAQLKMDFWSVFDLMAIMPSFPTALLLHVPTVHVLCITKNVFLVVGTLMNYWQMSKQERVQHPQMLLRAPYLIILLRHGVLRSRSWSVSNQFHVQH